MPRRKDPIESIAIQFFELPLSQAKVLQAVVNGIMRQRLAEDKDSIPRPDIPSASLPSLLLVQEEEV